MLLTFIILQRTDKLISIKSRATNGPLAGRSIVIHFDVNLLEFDSSSDFAPIVCCFFLFFFLLFLVEVVGGGGTC